VLNCEQHDDKASKHQKIDVERAALHNVNPHAAAAKHKP
jgi:hypothetical protein